MKKKKALALVMAAAMTLGLAACGSQPAGPGNDTPTSTPAASAPAESKPAASAPAASTPSTGDKYTVGICQLVQHPALDAATQGFIDVLNESMPGQVEILNQNASNDIPTCSTIVNGFVADQVDLMLCNATPALQAAVAATTEIPILGTSVTEYGVALKLDDFNGTVGGNVSGTSDLAPLDQQAQMVMDIFPDAQKVGILYCSGEANSVYQANVVKECLETAGKTVTVYTFADSNDVAAVTQSACGENEVLYIPTDNTAASCAEAINNVAEPAGIPIIAGEEGICKGCGVATLSIDYYELGRTTGEMAVKILKGEADISTMPIEYYPNPVKKYNAELATSLNVTIPDGYEAIA